MLEVVARGWRDRGRLTLKVVKLAKLSQPSSWRRTTTNADDIHLSKLLLNKTLPQTSLHSLNSMLAILLRRDLITLLLGRFIGVQIRSQVPSSLKRFHHEARPIHNDRLNTSSSYHGGLLSYQWLEVNYVSSC